MGESHFVTIIIYVSLGGILEVFHMCGSVFRLLPVLKLETPGVLTDIDHRVRQPQFVGVGGGIDPCIWIDFLVGSLFPLPIVSEQLRVES